MAGPAGEFHHGEMDVHAQQATYRAVMTGSKWACLVLAVGLVFFTLLFCTNAGFISAFLSAIVLTVIGIVGLRSRSPAH